MLLASGLLVLLTGCRPAAPPAATAPPTPPPPPPPQLEFRWLTTAETTAAEGLLDAPRSAPAKTAFLAAYRRTRVDLKQASGSSIVGVLLRLWEWNRAVRVAQLSAAEVRAGVGLAKAKAPPSYHRAPTMDQPQEGWRLATPATFDADVRKVLRATKAEGGSYADFVGRWLRYTVVVESPGLLDPNLPLRCEGTVEPLSGTAFITERDAITSQRRPAWKIAAALVHEAEHVRWYYEGAGDDARRLLPLPDERNAYRRMFLFAKEVRLGGVADSDRALVAQDMQRWRGIVQQANALLGYPADDFSVRTDLNVSDEALRTDPVVCPAPTAEGAGSP